MKFIHLSDLHLGKRLNEFSLLEDQHYILLQILQTVGNEKPDAVFISGDIYDKSVPSAEAVELFDDFLVRLAKLCPQIFVISGNHDSPERLAFGGRVMDLSGVHFSPVYAGELRAYPVSDEFGEVRVYLLPFVKPASVRHFFPDEDIQSYTDAVRCALSVIEHEPGSRSVLLTHQFVTGAERSESEEISVGGSDNVDSSVFEGFDYVALGHIHRAQNIGSERIRYCGTPLKYSFSESKNEKSITVGILGKDGELTVSTVPLVPMRDLVELRGSYEELTARSFYDGSGLRKDYLRITLTDEDEIPDAAAKLRLIYENIMRLEYDNTKTRHNAELTALEKVEERSPMELFSDFYEQLNGVSLTDEQTDYLTGLIEKVWGGQK